MASIEVGDTHQGRVLVSTREDRHRYIEVKTSNSEWAKVVIVAEDKNRLTLVGPEENIDSEKATLEIVREAAAGVSACDASIDTEEFPRGVCIDVSSNSPTLEEKKERRQSLEGRKERRERVNSDKNIEDKLD